jgi:hypothetical protein
VKPKKSLVGSLEINSNYENHLILCNMACLLQISQVEAYMYIVYNSIGRLLETRTDPWRLSGQFSLLMTILFKRTKSQFDI